MVNSAFYMYYIILETLKIIKLIINIFLTTNAFYYTAFLSLLIYIFLYSTNQKAHFFNFKHVSSITKIKKLSHMLYSVKFYQSTILKNHILKICYKTLI